LAVRRGTSGGGGTPGVMVIPGLRGCLPWCVAAGAGVIAVADADAPLRAALSAALEANERLREELARRDAEIERLSAELAVLQRMVFGRSSGGPGRRTWPRTGMAATRAATVRAAGRAGRGGRGRGPGGGITRICPGSR